jgi:hypothetical protein
MRWLNLNILWNTFVGRGDVGSLLTSEVALRFHIHRSAVSGAAYRVGNDADLTSAVKAILTLLLPAASQQ